MLPTIARAQDELLDIVLLEHLGVNISFVSFKICDEYESGRDERTHPMYFNIQNNGLKMT